ncbi:MAG TPA: hypothetical protein VHW96_06235 [Solirubrobacteraceae bacterium]|nr:hypothetical protein [Solirubrobacteraceae bacterium]
MAISPQALRVLIGPDIKIVPGRAVMARVVQAAPGQKGSLSIAGYLLDAELPENVQTGDDLRLVVRDVNAERVLLAISDPENQSPPTQQAPGAHQGQEPQQTQQAQPLHAELADPSLAAPPPVPLPGGGDVQVTERDAGGAGGRAADRQNVLLRYNAPALGAVDLRFQMDAGALSLSVTLPPGQPHELARAGAERLRQALGQSLPGRAVSVTVSARREPLDLYA